MPFDLSSLLNIEKILVMATPSLMGWWGCLNNQSVQSGQTDRHIHSHIQNLLCIVHKYHTPQILYQFIVEEI